MEISLRLFRLADNPRLFNELLVLLCEIFSFSLFLTLPKQIWRGLQLQRIDTPFKDAEAPYLGLGCVRGKEHLHGEDVSVVNFVSDEDD